MIRPDIKVLVVAAHPDDEVLGCGGTLIRFQEIGATIAVLFMGEGSSARFPYQKSYNSKLFKEMTKIRMNESKSAMKVLGVKNYKFGSRYCGQFDNYALISLIKEIENKLEEFKPDILLTHTPSEVHIDHRLTYEAVEVACRPTRPYIPNEIYTFEIPSSTIWKFDSSFIPNVFVDVKEVWHQKLRAWHCYEGEARPFPFPRSDQGLDTLAKMRGMTAGLIRAEAFQLLRKIV